MTFGLAVQGGKDGESLTYTDTQALHAGVLIKQKLVEITDDYQNPTYNYVDIDFSAESAGYTQFAFAVIHTGCSGCMGNPLFFWWFGGYDTVFMPNYRSPTVTLTGTTLRVRSNSAQWYINRDFNATGITMYQSYNVLIIGLK
jgi:hypothetical protein